MRDVAHGLAQQRNRLKCRGIPLHVGVTDQRPDAHARLVDLDSVEIGQPVDVHESGRSC